ncbi:hypothetical protein IWZ03DRAFT_170848 [Phyllosticta citriasiana]|uniref:Uncharacterized protein n=1 Tax=Phyllosticta citriasiana TaxID=595635 RepID=A0ABR1KLL6_9PEZI
MIVAMPWMPPPMAISRRDRGSREHGLSATGRKTPLFFFFFFFLFFFRSLLFFALSAQSLILRQHGHDARPLTSCLLGPWLLRSSSLSHFSTPPGAVYQCPAQPRCRFPKTRSFSYLDSSTFVVARSIIPFLPTRPYLPDHRPGPAPNPARWKGRLLPFGRLLALAPLALPLLPNSALRRLYLTT